MHRISCQYSIVLALLLGGILLYAESVLAETALRVGVYQNAPGNFYDAQGKVQGFYIDQLEHAARQEGWQLNYVLDTWPKLLTMMDAAELDLLVGIAYTHERTERFDFNRETVLSNWAQIYVKDPEIQSILSTSR